MVRRVLFVDDEPSIRGFYEMLTESLGEGYSVATAGSPEEAVARFGQEVPDMIVSDLVMPGTSGAELLLDLAQRYPQCARIVVSGFADQITLAKCVTVAHRYFTKPFSPTALTTAIHELVDTHSRRDERMRNLVGRIQSLPVPSETYLLLTKALNSHGIPLETVADVVQRDPALCSKLLQAANSAMFGSHQRVIRIRDALQMVGLEAARTLVLSIQVFELCPARKLKPFLDRLWRHSLDIASKARQIAELTGAKSSERDEASLGGLLHDIGKVVLAAGAPNEYEAILQNTAWTADALKEAEFARFGATHPEAGGYLLKLWGLPDSLITVVEGHHSPWAELEKNAALRAVALAHRVQGDVNEESIELALREVSDTGASASNRAVLIASNDAFEVEKLSAVLRGSGFVTFSSDTRSSTHQMLHDLTFQAALIDERLFSGPSEEIQSQLRQVNGTVKLLMFSALPRHLGGCAQDFLRLLD